MWTSVVQNVHMNVIYMCISAPYLYRLWYTYTLTYFCISKYTNITICSRKINQTVSFIAYWIFRVTFFKIFVDLKSCVFSWVHIMPCSLCTIISPFLFFQSEIIGVFIAKDMDLEQESFRASRYAWIKNVWNFLRFSQL